MCWGQQMRREDAKRKAQNPGMATKCPHSPCATHLVMTQLAASMNPRYYSPPFLHSRRGPQHRLYSAHNKGELSVDASVARNACSRLMGII